MCMCVCVWGGGAEKESGGGGGEGCGGLGVYWPWTHRLTHFLKGRLPHYVEDAGGEDEEAVSLAALRPDGGLRVQRVRAVRLHRLERHRFHGQDSTWRGTRCCRARVMRSGSIRGQNATL